MIPNICWEVLSLGKVEGETEQGLWVGIDSQTRLNQSDFLRIHEEQFTRIKSMMRHQATSRR